MKKRPLSDDHRPSASPQDKQKQGKMEKGRRKITTMTDDE
jgi:hypothetical protein